MGAVYMRKRSVVSVVSVVNEATRAAGGSWRSALKLLIVGGSMALLAAGCASDEPSEQAVARAPAPVRTELVTKGDISSTVSFSGEVQAVDRLNLTASVNGRLEEVLVEEGAEVRAGTALARLERDILTAQVRQAEANLASAQARLQTIVRGARPEEIAAVRANLEAQRSRLRSITAQEAEGGIVGVATANLAATEAKVTGDRSTARAALVTARASRAAAEARYEQLVNPLPSDINVAEAVVAAAEEGLVSVQRRLEQLRNPTKLDLAASAASVDSTRAALASAEAALLDLKASPTVADEAAARAAAAAAETSYRTTLEAHRVLITPLNDVKVKALIQGYRELYLARLELEESEQRGEPEPVIIELENAVNRALQLLDIVAEEAGTYELGVSAGQILTSEAALDAALKNKQSAEARLADVLDGPSEVQLTAAQAAVDLQRANFRSAAIRHDRLKLPTAADIASVEAAIANAKSLLATARNHLTTLLNPTAVALNMAQATLEKARADFFAAEAHLARLTAGASVAELETAHSGIAKAEADIAGQEAAVAQAMQQLELTVNRHTAADVNVATAAVAQAEAALDLSLIQLKRATIVAPFDAVVAQKLVSKGTLVSPQTPVFALVSKAVHVSFNVEEGTIGRLSIGQTVTFQLAAFGERAISGKISSIAPTADAASRTFRVKVAPDDGQQGLRAGMFANVIVAIEARDDVLLVPVDAVVQRGNDLFVFVVKNDTADERKVELGLRTERFAEVRAGVELGEAIVTRGNRTLRNGDKVTVLQ